MARKRKREPAGTVQSTKRQGVHASHDNGFAVSRKQRRRVLPFAGKVIAVSSSADDTVNYKGLRSLCESGGAKITSQVHKRVYCVVATDSAVSGQTQRVRKAWKKGIIVIKTDWVRRCLEEETLLPFGHDEIISQPHEKEKTKGSALTGAIVAKEEDDAVDVAERSLDLGCCCVCHETGATDCPWCKHCSVTLEERLQNNK